MVRRTNDTYPIHSDSITFLNLRKHTGIVLKKGDRAVVVSDLSDTDKNYKYSVQPYLDSCKVSDPKICAPMVDLQLPFILKSNNLIQFGDKRLLIFDKQSQKTTLVKRLKLDYLFISGNPDADINSINKNYDYKLLVIDNNNSTSLINRLKDQANQAGIDYWVLQRNKSAIIASN
jgi:competence protein ComEC